jgi:hypothetical protein
MSPAMYMLQTTILSHTDVFGKIQSVLEPSLLEIWPMGSVCSGLTRQLCALVVGGTNPVKEHRKLDRFKNLQENRDKDYYNDI